MNLLSILEEQILVEGRKEEVMEKYPDLDPQVIEAFSSLDPSGTNKYLEWAAKAYYGTAGKKFMQEYVDSLMNYIIKYHNKQASITPANVEEFFDSGDIRTISSREMAKIKDKPKDINSFEDPKTFGIFVDFIDSLKSKKKEISEIKSESDRVYEDSDILIVSPRTHRSSCHYGKHSTWCVATSNTSYYGNYTKDGTLYFFLSRKDKEFTPEWGEETISRHREGGQPAHTPPFKVALLIKDDGDMTWWSKNDSNFVTGDLADLSSGGWIGDRKLPFLTEAMAEKILSYNRHAIENRMQRQIEALVKSKGFYSQNRGDKDDFIKLVKSNILNADQLGEIIQNDNWLILYENSDTSKMIRSILGPEKIFDMIKKMLKSKDITQTLVDFSENKFLTSYEGLTEEQSREIASIITKKLGSKPTKDTHGLDAKVFVDKWTMSPEDWNKFNSITNYIFIGKIEGKTPKISPDKASGDYFTKIDRFKVTDFDKIEKLQMQAKYLNENLYGVVTEKGLLDQFKGDVEDMPKEVMMTIIQKARPLYKSK